MTPSSEGGPENEALKQAFGYFWFSCQFLPLVIFSLRPKYYVFFFKLLSILTAVSGDRMGLVELLCFPLH